MDSSGFSCSANLMQNHDGFRKLSVAIAFTLIAKPGISATPVLALLLVHFALPTSEGLNTQHSASSNLPVWRWSMIAAIICVALSTSAYYILSEGSLRAILAAIPGRYFLVAPLSRDFQLGFADITVHLFGQFSLLIGDALLFKTFLNMHSDDFGLKQRMNRFKSTPAERTAKDIAVPAAILTLPVVLAFLMVYSQDFRLSVASPLGLLTVLAYPLLTCIALSFMLAETISVTNLLNRTGTD